MSELDTSKHPARDAWQGTLIREPDGDFPETRWGCGHWHRDETKAIHCAGDTWPFAKEAT